MRLRATSRATIRWDLFTKSVVIDKNDFTEFMNNCWWAGENKNK